MIKGINFVKENSSKQIGREINDENKVKIIRSGQGQNYNGKFSNQPYSNGNGFLGNKRDFDYFLGKSKAKENSTGNINILNATGAKLLQAIKTESNEDTLPKKLEFKLSHILHGENTMKKIEECVENSTCSDSSGGERKNSTQKENSSEILKKENSEQNIEKNIPSQNLEFYNDEMVNALMYWKKSGAIGPGFNNLGNTCFLNSVLQSLLYTPAIRNYLTYSDHLKTCRAKGVCFLCEFGRLINSLSKHSKIK
jgi:hypothetical protein